MGEAVSQSSGGLEMSRRGKYRYMQTYTTCVVW
jgi:hypothetical protein